MNEEQLETMRHSGAHIMAAAIYKLFPDAKFGIGPAIADGFYYDIELPRTLIPEDLPNITKEMKTISKANLSFERQEINRKEAIELFEKAGQSYKVELLKEMDDDKVTIYKLGDFVDLCRGPHLDSSGEIKAFELDRIAGAYWRGDEKNKMLQRVYGLAFLDPKELRKYKKLREEAKKRDHRKLGKELELFTFSDKVGTGLPLWLPNGAAMKEELEKWGKETEAKRGYERISTPIMTKRELFETSGHIPYFEEEMYKVEVPGDDKEEYFLRPMNCPFAHLVYQSKIRSYRDLPLRLAEYGTVARYEQAGAVNGILRPRVFTQNDAHIYCTEEQAIDMFVEIIDLHRYYYDKLGLKDYRIILELRDPANKDKYHGKEAAWKKSEELSIAAMKKAKIDFEVRNEGAAHYGPKMDFKIKSIIGTEYGISTNQIDLYMPERFKLTYKDKDGKDKPVIVQHRAPLGSDERFIGFLIEHFAGKFPLWISPKHIVIIPVSEKFNKYASEIKEESVKIGWDNDIHLRADIDDSNESVGKKIRQAEVMKYPYMLVVGEKEKQAKNLTVRTRGQKEQRQLSSDEFAKLIIKNIKQRKLDLT
ncbi:threonine--tRNA ligase [Patescibacteria group bacterium]